MRTILRAGMLGLSILSFHAAILSQQVAKTIPYSGSPEGLIGFLQFTPSDYGSQKHPLIIFLHGIGERGNGTTQINSVAANAIPKFCAAGATMRFTVNGQTSSFVVLSPQLSTQLGYWPTYYVKQMIAYAKANLTIDTNRIYVCGLSLGGGGVWRLITDTQNFDHTFDGTIAAAAPVCGTQEETDADFCTTIGTNHLPVWAFHSMDDGTVNVNATQHAEILANMCGNFSPAMKFTYYQSGGHGGAWINAYDTGHITVPVVVNGVVSNFTANPNLYEWFLSYSRAASTGNTAPVANAGSAQTITLPTSTVNLSGTGTGTNGATISSYAWVKTSGPSSGSISSSTSASTAVTGLVQGTYVFTLTVTDNHGLTSSSTVTITVNAAPAAALPVANQIPVANAGANQTITLPNTLTLNGSASYDPDGTITGFWWTQTAGPTGPAMTTRNAVTTNVTGLVAGTYTFILQVTDNAGALAFSAVTITVNAASATNQIPVANAGIAQTITLPANTVTLDGSASYDPDGTITGYWWTQTAGPTGPVMTTRNAVTTNVTGLVAGTYTFVLQVTDNAGALSFSAVTITVNAAPVVTASVTNQIPVANAGAAQTITLPVNTVTLNASASYDPDGSITGYWWTQTSGPTGPVMTTRDAVTTNVTGLVAGAYTFVLQVTDNAGAIDFSSVNIIVNAATTASQPIGYIKQTVGFYQACSDASSDSRIPIYCSSIANGNIVYLDAGLTNLYNGGYNWFSFTPVLGGPVTKGFSVFPDGTIHLLAACAAATQPATTPASTSALLGYIKMSVGPYQACSDASSDGRIPIYGTSIANGSYLYSDAAMTQVYNGGWNWYSFTPVLGGSATYAFAIYPIGSIGLLRNCSSSSRTATPLEEITLAQPDAAATGKLSIFPNPVRSNAILQLSSLDNGAKTINVYNASGVLMSKYIWQTIKGNNTFSLKNISGLPAGLYIADVRDTNGKQVGKLKFVKQY